MVRGQIAQSLQHQAKELGLEKQKCLKEENMTRFVFHTDPRHRQVEVV